MKFFFQNSIRCYRILSWAKEYRTSKKFSAFAIMKLLPPKIWWFGGKLHLSQKNKRG
jgi:hypothetical protein